MNGTLRKFQAPEVTRLLRWYAKHQRDFPWRREPDPYRVWLAEVMSQQTRMNALVPYFCRFMERFPNVDSLAAATIDEVLGAWSGLGYYSRARNVHRTAKIIVNERGGKFPETAGAWRQLPGVGPYTAAAVASQAFGARAPVWDGNVLRVCARLDARSDALSTLFRNEAQAVLLDRMRGHDPSQFNQAFMELGALVCTPRAPACGRCPLAASCEALRLEAVERFPPRKSRRSVVELECRVHIRLRYSARGVEAFLQPRAAHQWFAGLWDFPSELGGSSHPLEPLARRLAKAQLIGRVRHQITHHKITLVGMMSTQASKASQSGGRWLHLEDLASDAPPVPLSTTARKVIRLITPMAIDQLATL